MLDVDENPLVIMITAAFFFLLLFDGHGSHSVCSLEIFNFKVCPGFLGEEQLGVHFKISYFPVQVDKGEVITFHGDTVPLDACVIHKTESLYCG